MSNVKVNDFAFTNEVVDIWDLGVGLIHDHIHVINNDRSASTVLNDGRPIEEWRG